MKKILILCFLVLTSIVNAVQPFASKEDKALFEIIDLIALNNLTNTNTIKEDDLISKLEKLHNAGHTKASCYYMNAIMRSDERKADKIGELIFPNLLKLAQNNDAHAAMMITSFYRFGIGGVKEDSAQAQFWHKKYFELQEKERQKDNPDPIIILNIVALDILSEEIPSQKEIEYLKSCGSKYATYVSRKLKRK